MERIEKIKKLLEAKKAIDSFKREHGDTLKSLSHPRQFSWILFWILPTTSLCLSIRHVRGFHCWVNPLLLCQNKCVQVRWNTITLKPMYCCWKPKPKVTRKETIFSMKFTEMKLRCPLSHQQRVSVWFIFSWRWKRKNEIPEDRRKEAEQN